jgi:hypothetical protein
MNTGTMALNADAGKLSSSAAPAGRTRDQADGVGDVGDDRRVTEAEQDREREQRPTPDDGVDRPRDDAGEEDRDCMKQAHHSGT